MERTVDRSGTLAAGVTLPELLVVIAIISLAVTIAIPIMSDTIRTAKGRAAVNGLTVTMKAARMSAVTSHRPIQVRVFDAGDQNAYELERPTGPPLRVEMPRGVRIVSSTSPIVFEPTGAVLGGASTRIEVEMRDGSKEIWDIATSPLGLSNVDYTVAPPGAG